MLGVLLFPMHAEIAAPVPSGFRCVEPEGLATASIVGEEADDLEERTAFDEAARKRDGDHALRVGGAASGCAHLGRCAPFVGANGFLFQRLGNFLRKRELR